MLGNIHEVAYDNRQCAISELLQMPFLSIQRYLGFFWKVSCYMMSKTQYNREEKMLFFGVQCVVVCMP